MKSSPAPSFPALLEGPEWLMRHNAVQDGTLSYLCQLNLEPWMDARGSGVKARDHWNSLPNSYTRALEVNWAGVRGMDIDRRLDDGTLVGCFEAEWIDGMIRGRFPLGGEPDRLEDAYEPCRDVFEAAEGQRFIYVNSEPWSDMHSTNNATREAWRVLYTNPKFLARLPEHSRECGPDTWGDPVKLDIARVTAGRLFHMAKLATIRDLLRVCGMISPGLTVIVSFCRFGSTRSYAAGHNDEPVPALTAPRDTGVTWATNWQWYGLDNATVTRAALMREASTGPIVPTIWGVNNTTARGILRNGCRGGVVWYIDEDMRAEAEGRKPFEGDQKTASEDWQTNQAAWLTRELREVAA